MTPEKLKPTLRREVKPSDPEAVREILVSSGFFRDDEIPVAVELVQECLEKGPACGYEFFFADVKGKLVAYACYGLIPCTIANYDLYWIAAHQDFRGKGVGTILLKAVESAVMELGGRGLYIETSSLPTYQPTRDFYLRNGYPEVARLQDFYQVGDDKVVYAKRFEL